MRTGTRLIVGILPLFLVLGCAYALALVLLTRSEVQWAIHEPAKSLLNTTNSFVTAEVVGEALAGADDGSLDSRLRALLAWRICDRIALLDVQGRPLRHYGGDWEPPQSLLRDHASYNGVSVGAVEALADGFQVAAVGTITDEDGQGRYLLAIRRPVTSSMALLDAAQRQALHLGLIILALGMVSLIPLSRLITRSLKSLQVSAHSAVAHPGTLQPARYLLREVADVDNAMATMSSVLADLVDQDRRGVVLGEQRRGPDALAAAWCRRCVDHTPAQSAALDFHLPFCVDSHRALIARYLPSAEGGYVVIVASEAGDTLQALLAAEAYLRWLQQGGPELLQGDALDLPGLCITCLRLDLANDEMEVVLGHSPRRTFPLRPGPATALLIDWQGRLSYPPPVFAQRVRSYAALDAKTQEELLARVDPQLFARLLVIHRGQRFDP